jgi:hypothetical protein
MNSLDTIRPRFHLWQRNGATLGAIGVILWLIFGFVDGQRHGFAGWQQFFRSYLFAYVYFMCIPLGSMGLLMLHHLTGGKWSYPIRRILEACTRSLWLMFLLGLPMLMGMRKLYAWARPADVQADPILQQKQWWLNPTGFVVRYFIYFAILLLIVTLLNKWSRQQDETGDIKYKDSMEAISGPGLVLWSLIVTGACVDWVMSLEPHWFSTIYGMLFIVIEALSALAFSLFMLRRLADYEPIKNAVDPKRFNDLGNLMLTFVMLWAYLSFDQLLITWAGNLKDEITWYTQRAFGGWAPIGVTLVVLHFFTPFLLLLQRGVKRRLRALSFVAGLILVLTLLDIYWIVVPSYVVYGPRVHWLDVFALLGIGGLWIAVFSRQLMKLPLLPQHDPRFAGIALELEHGD